MFRSLVSRTPIGISKFRSYSTHNKGNYIPKLSAIYFNMGTITAIGSCGYTLYELFDIRTPSIPLVLETSMIAVGSIGIGVITGLLWPIALPLTTYHLHKKYRS